MVSDEPYIAGLQDSVKAIPKATPEVVHPDRWRDRNLSGWAVVPEELEHGRKE